MQEDGDTVWELTDENRGSYEKALARAVKRDLGLSASQVTPISNIDDANSALISGNYRNVVYVRGGGAIAPGKAWERRKPCR